MVFFIIKILFVVCHSSCKECFNPTRFGCVDCNEGNFLFENQCVPKCPARYYPDRDQWKCEKCISPCNTCFNSTLCITCQKGFYWRKDTQECVDKDGCPKISTYPDDNTNTCEKCHYSCLTCYGPSSRECILCNFALGFGRTGSGKGECYMLLCTDNMYLNIDYNENIASCKRCHETCKTCKDETANACTECKTGLKVAPSDKGDNYVLCQTCEMLNSKYYTAPDGTCMGIFKNK